MSLSMESARSDEPSFPYRMKDLCEISGLGRQAIHFYIQRGLLPPGKKTGRNMAWYGEEHVERLQLIRKLQHERFLPLKAIKAILDDQQEHFSSTQRSFLLGVKQHLGRSLAADADAPTEAAPARPVLERLDLPAADLERMIELELIGAREEGGEWLIAPDDVWLLESWAEVKRLGFVEDLGFGVADLLLLDEIVGALFVREAQLVASRMPDIEPERAAEMIERALPIVHGIFTAMHRRKIQNFLSSLD